MITLIFGAIFMLGICIFIHELGHLFCGYLVGVKARIFSIGYGKGIWKKKIGSTIYQVTAIPIGGYVLFRDDYYGKKNVKRKGSLSSVHPLLRMVPVLGGPIFNLIFGFLLLFFLNLSGDNPLSNRIFIDKSLQEVGSPAYQAGLRTNDQILSINGKDTKTFEDIFNIISLSSGEPLKISYQRDSQVFTTEVIPEIQSNGGRPTIGIQPYGERRIVVNFTYVEQIRHYLFKFIQKDDTARWYYGSDTVESLGVKSRGIEYLNDGDVILKVAGRDVQSIRELQEILGKYQNQTVNITLKRKLYPLLNPWSSEIINVQVPTFSAFRIDFSDVQDKKIPDFFLKKLSFLSYQPNITDQLKKIKIDDQYFDSFSQMKDYLLKLPAEQVIDLQLGFLSYTARFKIGAIGLLGFKPSIKFEAEKVKKDLNFATAFAQAGQQVYEFVEVTLKGLKMLFSGLLSPSDSLSGPIGIVQFAGLSLEYGWFTYLDFMAKISIALMIMNLLPIPLTDGGHIVLYAYEAIVGKPVPFRVIDIIFRLSFLFFIGLSLLVAFNDIMRFF